MGGSAIIQRDLGARGHLENLQLPHRADEDPEARGGMTSLRVTQRARVRNVSGSLVRAQRSPTCPGTATGCGCSPDILHSREQHAAFSEARDRRAGTRERRSAQRQRPLRLGTVCEDGSFQVRKAAPRRVVSGYLGVRLRSRAQFCGVNSGK